MFCPNDGEKMSLWDITDRYTASNCFKCDTCDMILRYRSGPSRFEIIDEGCPGCYNPECPKYLSEREVM